MKVEVAYHGREALTKIYPLDAEGKPIDLVSLDWGAPEHPGSTSRA